MEKIRKVLLYAGVEKKDFDVVKKRIINTDRGMVQLLSAIATILILAMFVMTLFVEGVSMNRIVYGVGILVSLALFLTSVINRKYDKLVMPMVYISHSIFYLYGIMIGAVTDPSQKTVTFMVMLVFLPVLFIGRPIVSIVVTIAHIALFIGLCLVNKTGGVLANDIIDSIIFGLLGIVSGTIIDGIKVSGFVLEEKLKLANLKLKDATRIDVLTGMQNRNAYERDLYSLSRECNESLGCVYIDVNGLKYFNDNYGHKQGDVMLKIVATKIKEIYGEKFSYRIGGDEFIIFIMDPENYEIKTKTDAFIKEIEKMDYHASVGWKIHNLSGLSMKDLIEEAERFMFEKKVEFYKRADFDRRKH